MNITSIGDRIAASGIHHVMPSVAAAAGAPGFTNSLGVPDARRFVVFLVDGLGQLALEEHAELAPWLAGRQRITNLVAGLPSTTSVSLTSLGTGLRPGSHGMVGYTSRIPGTESVLNTLKWDPTIDPAQWQPRPAVLSRLPEHGIATAVVNDRRFATSGLTLCSQRDVEFFGADRSWERIDALCEFIESNDRAIAYGYDSRLDHEGHGHGIDSEQWRTTLTTIDADLAELAAALPSDTEVLITADHGMLDIGPEDRFDVRDHPELLDDVVLIAGEARFRHIHTRAGSEAHLAATWAELLGDRAVVLQRGEAQAWLGPIDREVAARFGDVIVVARDDFAVFDSENHGIEMSLVGFHGSFSDAELEIPFLQA